MTTMLNVPNMLNKLNMLNMNSLKGGWGPQDLPQPSSTCQ